MKKTITKQLGLKFDKNEEQFLLDYLSFNKDIIKLINFFGKIEKDNDDFKDILLINLPKELANSLYSYFLRNKKPPVLDYNNKLLYYYNINKIFKIHELSKNLNKYKILENNINKVEFNGKACGQRDFEFSLNDKKTNEEKDKYINKRRKRLIELINETEEKIASDYNEKLNNVRINISENRNKINFYSNDRKYIALLLKEVFSILRKYEENKNRKEALKNELKELEILDISLELDKEVVEEWHNNENLFSVLNNLKKEEFNFTKFKTSPEKTLLEKNCYLKEKELEIFKKLLDKCEDYDDFFEKYKNIKKYQKDISRKIPSECENLIPITFSFDKNIKNQIYASWKQFNENKIEFSLLNKKYIFKIENSCRINFINKEDSVDISTKNNESKIENFNSLKSFRIRLKRNNVPEKIKNIIDKFLCDKMCGDDLISFLKEESFNITKLFICDLTLEYTIGKIPDGKNKLGIDIGSNKTYSCLITDKNVEKKIFGENPCKNGKNNNSDEKNWYLIQIGFRLRGLCRLNKNYEKRSYIKNYENKRNECINFIKKYISKILFGDSRFKFNIDCFIKHNNFDQYTIKDFELFQQFLSRKVPKLCKDTKKGKRVLKSGSIKIKKLYWRDSTRFLKNMTSLLLYNKGGEKFACQIKILKEKTNNIKDTELKRELYQVVKFAKDNDADCCLENMENFAPDQTRTRSQNKTISNLSHRTMLQYIKHQGDKQGVKVQYSKYAYSTRTSPTNIVGVLARYDKKEEKFILSNKLSSRTLIWPDKDKLYQMDRDGTGSMNNGRWIKGYSKKIIILEGKKVNCSFNKNEPAKWDEIKTKIRSEGIKNKKIIQELLDEGKIPISKTPSDFVFNKRENIFKLKE